MFHCTALNELTEGKCKHSPLEGSGGGVVGLIFAGYLPLASQSPYPIIVYSVANYRLHLIHFWENM